MLNPSLDNFDQLFPVHFSPQQKAEAQTLFFKKLSLSMHRYFGGKMMTLPKVGVWGHNWFNVWYTPGVSQISTAIRDNNDLSFELSGRGNMVAIVSDSTRVLGDGDCTPAGGLGVMEGKAFLMKYLGGVDALALCVDSRNDKGESDPEKIISFVQMAQPSLGAVNLEDISTPNCYRVLDELQKKCSIPVWHDDAQGTACVTLAGLMNALKLADKEISRIKIVFMGAGASNTSIIRLLRQCGADPERIIVFDHGGALHRGREEIKNDPREYRRWQICTETNPACVNDIETALQGADVLIAFSRPGPDTIKTEWIRKMNKKAIVFACANPVPEIYPYAARDAGAFIVATGRSDFPNQINNSLGFPGIMKGTLLVRAKSISDEMSITAAQTIASFTEKSGLNPDRIIPSMDEWELVPLIARDVGMCAVRENLARVRIDQISAEQIYERAYQDINASRTLIHHLMEESFIKRPPQEMLQKIWQETLEAISPGI